MNESAAAILLLFGAAAYLISTVVLVPLVAVEKDRNAFGWLVLALVCTPLLALIALAAIPSSDAES